ncbi:APC family permease [Bacillus sp. OTU530]|uniref:APC family permease n=1 Tax=Bacillus sp. OTU530 TaxID=3043862 RepID=UPI00313C7F04
MEKGAVLAKSLTLHQVVFVGLAWMTPMIFFTVYGVAFEASGGLLVPAYLVAFLAIFFTAYSYGMMAKAYPIAGSAYTYTKKAVNPQMGFLVGWALLLDYIFSPIIACLTFGIFLNAQFPAIPVPVWIIGINIILAIVNIVGIKSVARISGFSVLLQIAFIVLLCALVIKDIVGGGGTLVSASTFLHPDMSLSTIFAGAAIICFCFLGFDAITTTAEETINPTKTIPKAIFIIVCIAAALYLSVSYFTKIAYPNFSFHHPDTASMELIKLIGGNLLNAIFIAVLVVAIFTQGVSSVTSVSRFLYALGKEAILPRKVFASIHPRFQTPVLNIVIVSVISLISLFISLDTAVTFVSFGALTAFTFVNISVIAHYYVRNRQRSLGQTFRYLIFPLIGAGFIGWLLTLLSKQTLVLGLVWLSIGFVYLFLRKKLSTNSSRERGSEEIA